jgi:serine/threonine protein kinase
LKSHNLLVDEHFKVKVYVPFSQQFVGGCLSKLQVCDFGLSTMVKRHVDRAKALTPVGTPCWTAPEILRNESYTEKADGTRHYLLASVTILSRFDSVYHDFSLNHPDRISLIWLFCSFLIWCGIVGISNT